MAIGFAHRGARLEHPDNTLAGFARALALGASGLESDAWVTADGVAVLDHDGEVRRRLARVPIGSLARRDLPAHIPTLTDLYRLPGAEEVEVSLDVKDPDAAPAVLDAAAGSRDRLWLCSPDLAALTAWRRLDDGAHLVHSTARRRIGTNVGGHATDLRGRGITALNLRAPQWDATAVAACHDAGVAAFAWDAQDRATITALVALGIDAVYSDHVATMVEVLAGR